MTLNPLGKQRRLLPVVCRRNWLTGRFEDLLRSSLLAREIYEFWCSRTVNCIGELTRFVIDPLHGKMRCPLQLTGDELLPAVNVVGRSGEGRVGHDVYGERGDVGR
jgi:hypothetical protein